MTINREKVSILFMHHILNLRIDYYNAWNIRNECCGSYTSYFTSSCFLQQSRDQKHFHLEIKNKCFSRLKKTTLSVCQVMPAFSTCSCSDYCPVLKKARLNWIWESGREWLLIELGTRLKSSIHVWANDQRDSLVRRQEVGVETDETIRIPPEN